MRPALRHGLLVERMLGHVQMRSHDGGAHGLLEAQARDARKQRAACLGALHRPVSYCEGRSKHRERRDSNMWGVEQRKRGRDDRKDRGRERKLSVQ